MATIDKKGKPKILTESDYILNDLREELAGLKSRMSMIEEEQEQNRFLLDQLSFQEDLTNELISNQQSENQINRENYEVIANVIHTLKTPVTSVVDNLAGILLSIDDDETQTTLQQCMDTASNVLNSFSEVEDFCLDLSSVQTPYQNVVDIEQFINEIISAFQNEHPASRGIPIHLKIEESIPDKCPVYTETIKHCLKNLLKELMNASSKGNITIHITSENNEAKFGIQISDLAVHLELSESVDFQWGESWVESIQANQDKLLNFGFNLLKTRDFLRKTGGHLEVAKEGFQIKGFRFFLPLTY